MGTRSNICRQNLDNSYDVIYCHWDGYPEHNGKILYEHYQDERKIAQLLALGDISSLGEKIGTTHNFDNPPKDECNAYGRDRKEHGCESKHYQDYGALMEMLEDAWTEWVYIYRVEDKKWYYTNNPSPTWFKLCGAQTQTALLTPAAWEEEKEA